MAEEERNRAKQDLMKHEQAAISRISISDEKFSDKFLAYIEKHHFFLKLYTKCI
jgi:hypothetical protein